MNNIARFISITPDAEKTMAYCARVSSPKNQDNENIAGLLRHCFKHGHWSVFEQANLIIEVRTSRAISPQILRHRSFTFQEFSQRYSEVDDYVQYEARGQDFKNRQNSIDNLNEETKNLFKEAQEEVWSLAFNHYKRFLELGVAKECARFLLPSNSSTTMYMNGTIRSWIHYIDLRSANGTQKEHQDIALACKEIFCQQLPLIASIMEWAS